ncbi:MAG: hypothetical protein KC583_12420 [Myxococcales bacterium]|nr:hypothetical protein [Myxococcales bacterium]
MGRALNVLGWIGYAATVAVAFATGWHDDILTFAGAAGGAKATLWIVWLGFLAYSIHCARHENLFRTVGLVGRYFWGRQICADLYISATLSLAIIHLNSADLVVTLLWVLPVLFYVNLAILVYVLVHFEQLIAHFA